MFQWLWETDNQQRGKKILVVSHGGPLTLLLAVFKYWTDGAVASVLAKKGEQSKAETDLSEQEAFFPATAQPITTRLKNYPRDDAGYLDPHRPFVDAVTIKCQCGGEMKRVKDLMDVWFD